MAVHQSQAGHSAAIGTIKAGKDEAYPLRAGEPAAGISAKAAGGVGSHQGLSRRRALPEACRVARWGDDRARPHGQGDAVGLT
jgi:hypothetical protein